MLANFINEFKSPIYFISYHEIGGRWFEKWQLTNIDYGTSKKNPWGQYKKQARGAPDHNVLFFN